jgi:anti-anti-sigma regulatory factor
MLKITLEDSSRELRFRLEGKLAGAWVGELRQVWQTAASTTVGRSTVVDLTDVDFVDESGQMLLSDMHHNGVGLVGVTPIMQSVMEEITSSVHCGTVEDRSLLASHVFRTSVAGGDPGEV